MRQHCESNRQPVPLRPWLKTYHEARKQRTADIVKATVDQLVHEECLVTIEAICLRSVEFDAQKKGVKKAGILGNEMAYAYYRQHSVSYQRAQKRKHPVVRKWSMVISSRPIDSERDIVRVRSRYLRQNKEDLVERLLAVEQAYAECCKHQN